MAEGIGNTRLKQGFATELGQVCVVHGRLLTEGGVSGRSA